MELYSQVTALISQNGRRAATMLSMDVSHPDIEEFIEIKQDLDKVTKANISVKVTDEFMNAVKEDKDFELRFTRKETGEEKVKTVKAKELFRKICECTWNTGEPGVLFWNRINNWNVLSEDPNYEYAGVNPCAEEPLPPAGACLLGSINLSAFVNDSFTSNAYFDYESFTNTVRAVVRELNIILDEGIPLHPLKEQQKTATDWRQIGTGIMGLADMLIKMGITYGSEEAIELCDNIASVMIDTALDESSNLAKKFGKYPNFNKKAILESVFVNTNAIPSTINKIKKQGLRNSQLLTIAPTGSLSNVLGISGGIEPIFANSYTRKTETLHEEDTYYKVYTPIVKEYMDKHGITDEKDLPDYFITAPEIPYEDRIKMQGTWQRHIDASISSTVNLPESATVEDIMDLYMKAWENGLKGITVFRDNCKRVGVLTTEKKEDKSEEATTEPIQAETIGLARGEVIQVSDNVVGLKRKLITGCGSLHCTAFFDPETGNMVETYLSKGSTGGCNNFMVGLSRMISLAARLGGSIYDIIDQLKSTGSCPSYAVRRATQKDTSIGSCCPMAVGNALLDMYEEFNGLGKYAEKNEEHFLKRMHQSKDWLLKPVEEVDRTFISRGRSSSWEFDNEPKIELREEAKCPQCGAKLDHDGGCDICRNCGWTKCD